MQNQNEVVETLEICDLEYDIAAVGAVESSDSTTNHAAYYFVSYRQPEAVS